MSDAAPGTPYGDVPRRAEALARYVEAGGRVAAALPVHVPRALLRAFDLLPVEVWGPPGLDTTAGDAHLQAYTCSVVRSGLTFVLGGALRQAELLLVPHTCDSLQGLASLLLDLVPASKPVLPLYIPRTSGETALSYFARELGKLRERLTEVTGQSPDDATLRAAIAREEAADRALAELLDARGRLALEDRSFYELVRSREFLPAEGFEELARAALDQPPAEPPAGAVPIVLSGMMPEPMGILDTIADAGGRVVGDDLACSGRRRYPAGTSEEPLRRIAESLLGAAPCSTLGSPIAARADHLIALAERTGARAVVFFEVKFCEPEQFYLPQVRQRLDAAGLHSVVIEVDIARPLPHQVVTRIEALFETIDGMGP